MSVYALDRYGYKAHILTKEPNFLVEGSLVAYMKTKILLYPFFIYGGLMYFLNITLAFYFFRYQASHFFTYDCDICVEKTLILRLKGPFPRFIWPFEITLVFIAAERCAYWADL